MILLITFMKKDCATRVNRCECIATFANIMYNGWCQRMIIIALDIESIALYNSKQISIAKAIVGKLFVWFVRPVKNLISPFLVFRPYSVRLFLYLSTSLCDTSLWYITTRLVLSHLSTLVAASYLLFQSLPSFIFSFSSLFSYISFVLLSTVHVESFRPLYLTSLHLYCYSSYTLNDATWSLKLQDPLS